MKHFYRDISGLGNVAVGRHAQERMLNAKISEATFERVLRSGSDTQIGTDVMWRQKGGLRIVILNNPTPNVGTKLVKTVYRVNAPTRVVGRR